MFISLKNEICLLFDFLTLIFDNCFTLLYFELLLLYFGLLCFTLLYFGLLWIALDCLDTGNSFEDC